MPPARRLCPATRFSQGTKSIVQQADIVIAAVGIPEFVKGDWVKPGAAVIDVGINPVPDSTKKTGYKLVRRFPRECTPPPRKHLFFCCGASLTPQPSEHSAPRKKFASSGCDCGCCWVSLCRLGTWRMTRSRRLRAQSRPSRVSLFLQRGIRLKGL